MIKFNIYLDVINLLNVKSLKSELINPSLSITKAHKIKQVQWENINMISQRVQNLHAQKGA